MPPKKAREKQAARQERLAAQQARQEAAAREKAERDAEREKQKRQKRLQEEQKEQEAREKAEREEQKRLQEEQKQKEREAREAAEAKRLQEEREARKAAEAAAKDLGLSDEQIAKLNESTKNVSLRNRAEAIQLFRESVGNLPPQNATAGPLPSRSTALGPGSNAPPSAAGIKSALSGLKGAFASSEPKAANKRDHGQTAGSRKERIDKKREERSRERQAQEREREPDSYSQGY